MKKTRKKVTHRPGKEKVKKGERKISLKNVLLRSGEEKAKLFMPGSSQ